MIQIKNIILNEYEIKETLIIPFILSMRFFISSAQPSQCMWTLRTTVTIWGCKPEKISKKTNHSTDSKAQINEKQKNWKRKFTSSFFSSSGSGFSSSSTTFSSSGGFGSGDTSSTFLRLFVWILSTTFAGSAFSPFTTTSCVLQLVVTPSTPGKFFKHRRTFRAQPSQCINTFSKISAGGGGGAAASSSFVSSGFSSVLVSSSSVLVSSVFFSS